MQQATHADKKKSDLTNGRHYWLTYFYIGKFLNHLLFNTLHTILAIITITYNYYSTPRGKSLKSC